MDTLSLKRYAIQCLLEVNGYITKYNNHVFRFNYCDTEFRIFLNYLPPDGSNKNLFNRLVL